MSELRRDPLTGGCVIMAQSRADRPQEYRPARRERTDAVCPFCEGNESETPPEVLARRAPDTQPDAPGWTVRIVPNKYPALRPEAKKNVAPQPAIGTDTVAGIHEVVIESSRHVTRTSDFSVDQLADTLAAYRDRLLQLSSNQQVRSAIVFKNVGPEAGATIEHTHSQLLGLPLIPPLVETTLANARRHRSRNAECLFCRVTNDELTAGKRIVASTDRLVAYCPFASRTAYETWIAPASHQPRFEQLDDEDISAVAELLLMVTRRIDEQLDKPDYNYILNTSPFDTRAAQNYHWSIVVLPRLTTWAGLEWGTGCTINPVLPEAAAGQLRIESLPYKKGEDSC